MSLTSPLGLMRHVRKPDLRLEVVPWLNVLLVAWLMSLLQSSYIYAPGLSIALQTPVRADASNPPTATAASSSSAPIASAGAQPGRRVDATLSVQPPFYYLDSGVYQITDLPQALADARRRLHTDQPVLLLLTRQDYTMGKFQEVSAMAAAAGFTIVQLAPVPAAPAGTAPGTAAARGATGAGK